MRQLLKGLMVLFLLLFLVACQTQEQSELFDWQGTKVGDNSAVLAIIKQLDEREAFERLELHTKQEPYGMTIDYRGLATLLQEKQETLSQSAYLFTLIPNVDQITFQYPDSPAMTVYRKELETVLSLNEYASDQELREDMKPLLSKPEKWVRSYQK